MDDQGIMYMAIGAMVAFVMIMISGTFGPVAGPIAILIAIGTMVAVLMMTLADFVLFPFITSFLKVSFIPAKGYKISEKQDTVIKAVGGLFYATGFVTASLFAYTFKEENMQENEEEQVLGSPEKWERAITAIDFPFKFHVLSAGRDVQKVREELEGKVSYQEFQLAKAEKSTGNVDTVITDINKKIAVLQTRMDRISKGERPISAIMYIETTAFGVSERAAIDSLASQVRKIQVSFSSFDLSLQRVVGRELYSLFNYNFKMPRTLEELTLDFDIQG